MLGHNRKSKPTTQVKSECIDLSSCLAKTWKQYDGTVLPGRDVFTHCLIVAKVAQGLIERMPNGFRDKYFPAGSALVAGGHDIGKVSPTFQNKLYKNLTQTPAEIWAKIAHESEQRHSRNN